ncbi:hypothetical protein SDJN03_04124, partial [Cucurbita argyrosperma subsp. sororia]
MMGVNKELISATVPSPILILKPSTIANIDIKDSTNHTTMAEVNGVFREKRFVGAAAAIGGWKSRTSKIKTRFNARGGSGCSSGGAGGGDGGAGGGSRFVIVLQLRRSQFEDKKENSIIIIIIIIIHNSFDNGV